jgi:O-antigen ligase
VDTNNTTHSLIYTDSLLDRKLGISKTNVPVFFFTLLALLYFIEIAFIDRSIYTLALISIVVLFSLLEGVKNDIAVTKIDILWLFPLFVIVWKTPDLGKVSIYHLLMTGLGIVFLVSAKDRIKRFHYSIKLIEFMAIPFAIAIILQYLFFDEYMTHIYPYFTDSAKISLGRTLFRMERYAGIASHVVYSGAAIRYGLGAVFCFWIFNNKLEKLIKIFMISLMLVALILTGSRTNLFFLPLGILLTYYVGSSNLKRLKLFVFILLVLIAAFLLLGIFEQQVQYYMQTSSVKLFNRIANTIASFATGDDITTGRVVLYEKAWSLFLSEPLTGVGWRQFARITEGILIRDVKSEVHNVYLQILTETGIIGFILIMTPIIYTYFFTYQQIVKIRYSSDGYEPLFKASLLFSFYIQSMFLIISIVANTFYVYTELYIYFFACAISISASLNRGEPSF